MSKRPRILELGNHAKVLQVLKHMAEGADLRWYEGSVVDVARHWLLLASQHLRAARHGLARARDWRAVVSRSYYAAYNASRGVRYVVNGFVKLDADDHKIVGDLPADFPDRASWSTFLVDLRKDRNIADYEPWEGIKSTLAQTPSASIGRAEEFLRQTKLYLRRRGIKL